MAKPDLKIIDLRNADEQINLQVVDLGWAKVTIEAPQQDMRMTSGNAVYALEMAKLTLMGK